MACILALWLVFLWHIYVCLSETLGSSVDGRLFGAGPPGPASMNNSS